MSDTVFHVDAILFDMDGTLIDSTAGVVGAWELFSQSYPGIEVDDILSSSHGVRTVDNLKTHCGIDDPVLLEKEAERFEQAILTSSSENGRQGIVQLPGVSAVMNQLAPSRFLPNPLWAICTSATRIYATSALDIAGVPLPEVLVTAEDVTRGKPYPDPYLLGAQQCGVNVKNCIRSGSAAGCKTIGLLTSHTREQVEAANPDFIVDDISKITVRPMANGVEIHIKSE